jgi:hypothetical protein
MSKFAEPPKDKAELHKTWLLWSTLEFLRGEAKKGSPYVPAKDLRLMLLKLMGYEAVGGAEQRSIEASAYRVLRSLRDAGAVGQINRRGMTGRKYFLHQGIGEDLLRAYETALSENQK